MGRQRFEALDGMRGVAAFAVLLYHCGSYLGGFPSFRHGFLSVDLFFVLSGFVIAFSYEQRLSAGLPLRGFLRARAKRLLPVHFWAMGVLTLVAFAAHAEFGGRSGFDPSRVLLLALMNSLFIPALGGSFGPIAFPLNPVLWSLWDEWVVNIAYAASIFRVRLFATAAVAAISWAFAIGFSFVFAGWNFGDLTVTLLPGVFRALGGFAAGNLIYLVHKRRWTESLPRVSPYWVFGGWLLLCANPVNSPATEIVSSVLIAPVVVALLVRGEREIAPVFRRLGAISYPLYASHLAVLIATVLIVRHAGLGPNPLYAVFAAAAALALAEIIRRLSEIRLGRALARFRTAKEAA